MEFSRVIEEDEKRVPLAYLVEYTFLGGDTMVYLAVCKPNGKWHHLMEDMSGSEYPLPYEDTCKYKVLETFYEGDKISITF